jgi:Spy/CpxP family protein refolding chaperone
MKPKYYTKMLIFFIAGLLVTSVSVFAWQGKGHREGMRHENCPMSKFFGYLTNDLTKEQLQKLEAERKDFISATQNLRQQIHEKRAALNAEMTKKNPDTARAISIQGEVSSLKSQLDRQWITHRIAINKIIPSFSGMVNHGRMGEKHCRDYCNCIGCMGMGK